MLFGLAIIVVLMLGDSSSAGGWIMSDETRVALLIVLTAVPPLFAAAQVGFFHYRFTGVTDLQRKRSALGRYAIWHFAVWLLASISTIVVIQWQFTVRSSWGMDRLPLVDELIIVAPSLISLVASWFILFETESNEIEQFQRSRARREYVTLRCKVYLLVVLIPITAMILVKDFWFVLEALPVYVVLAALVMVLLGLLALMPWLVGRIWSKRSINHAEGRNRLLQLCESEQMKVREILVWDTNQGVVNAVIAGIFPRFRVLMLSDLLLSTFPQHEIGAIVRHEAGHLKLAHLPIRLAFILIPAAAMIAMDLDHGHRVVADSYESTVFGMSVSTTLVPAILLGLLLLAVMAWLSRKMEFEADLYAAGLLNHYRPSIDDDPESTEHFQAMYDALCRFACQFPEQVSKSSLTHPSLQQRLNLIDQCSKNPYLAQRFRRQFKLQQVLLGGLMLILTGVMIFR